MTLTSRREALAELPAREVRVDIQGLRAVAVLLVVVFHLYPDRLTGGFIGVDVFFVVSGFLITSHLLRSPPRRPVDFAAFWGRRIRRLLPASLLVIVVTVVAACVLLPVSQLSTLARDAVASTLYVENWNLAASAVDYLAIGSAPSPFQHYWSLGVEEQFYLIWPLLIALVTLVAARRRSSTAVIAVGLGALVAASFVASVVWTATEPAAAYFVTPTRLWELGAGGLVAVFAGSVLARRRSGVLGDGARSLAAWIGLAMIAVSAFALSAQSPFPGAVAAVPVGGAALFLAADADRARFAPTRFLRWRPIQFVGDTSYSIYLWHFPLIVLGGALLGGPPGLLAKVVMVAACLVLAELTRRFVEDPVRRSVWLRVPLRRTFVIAAAATALTLGVSAIPVAQLGVLVARDAAVREELLAANAGCLGAAAVAAGSEDCTVRGVGILPSPAQAHDDVSDAYGDGCFAQSPFASVVTCEYGVPEDEATQRVALVGNSHAGQWLPALQELAEDRDLSITTYLASACMPTDALVLFDTQAAIDGCHEWGDAVVDATSDGDFDLVVTSTTSISNLVGVASADKFTPQAAGYARILQRWADAGQPLLVIRDTPIPGFDMPDCLAAHIDDAAACDGTPDDWLAPDPLIAAAEEVGDDRQLRVDLSPLFCPDDACLSVIGGVMVYVDRVHVGQTYMRTMAEFLAPSLESALGMADAAP